MQPTLARLRRLLLHLDLSVFDEARLDAGATIGSLAVAGASIVLFALGGWLWSIMSGLGETWQVFFKSVVLGGVFAFGMWLVWLLVVFGLLQRLTGRAPQVEPLLRTAGLAAAPAALGLLMVLQPIAFGLGLLALAAWVAMTQVAVERATGAPQGVAMVANLAGFGAWAAVMSLLTTSQNPFAPGPFLAESIWETVTAARSIFN